MQRCWRRQSNKFDQFEFGYRTQFTSSMYGASISASFPKRCIAGRLSCYAESAMKSTCAWRTKASVLAVLSCTMFIASCSSRRSNVVIYDQPWSRITGVKNFTCAPSVRDACLREALSDEGSFSKALSIAFETSPECKDIEFVVDAGVASLPQNSDAHLIRLGKSPRWRLQVDYYPRLMAQPFRLDLVGGGFKDYSRIGGESTATDMASFVCRVSNSNGVVDYW